MAQHGAAIVKLERSPGKRHAALDPRQLQDVAGNLAPLAGGKPGTPITAKDRPLPGIDLQCRKHLAGRGICGLPHDRCHP